MKERANDSGETRDKILDAAEAVFADKGFAGARMEQIANRAGVAKALIYYYFKGKDDLFQGIIERFITENIRIKGSAIGEKGDITSNMDSQLDAGMAFAREKLNVIRILFQEIMKKEKSGTNVLDTLEQMFRKQPFLQKALKDVPAEKQALIWFRAFFFFTIPSSLFLLLEDKWAEYYGLSREALETEFKTSIVKLASPSLHEFLDLPGE